MIYYLQIFLKINVSKFKNAIGEDLKNKYLNCSVITISTEGRYLAVNGIFLALAWSNIIEIVVIDSFKPKNEVDIKKLK